MQFTEILLLYILPADEILLLSLVFIHSASRCWRQQSDSWLPKLSWEQRKIIERYNWSEAGLVLYSPDEETHEVHLKYVLDILREHKLYVKFSKCEFWLSSIKFLLYHWCLVLLILYGISLVFSYGFVSIDFTKVSETK